MTTKPRYYRPMKNHVFGWEIHSWKYFLINISIKNFEIQINKFPKSIRWEG